MVNCENQDSNVKENFLILIRKRDELFLYIYYLSLNLTFYRSTLIEKEKKKPCFTS